MAPLTSLLILGTGLSVVLASVRAAGWSPRGEMVPCRGAAALASG